MTARTGTTWSVDTLAGVGVSVVGHGARRRAAAVLADAFARVPLYVRWMPRERGRRARLERIYRVVVCSACRVGAVLASSPAMEAVVVWVPGPGHPHGWRDAVFCGGWALPAFVPWRELRALAAIGRVSNAQRARLMPMPHAFLGAIGTSSVAEGHGHAGRLLAAGLTAFDRVGLPTYLETQSERNVAFFQRFGFEVAAEFEVEELRAPHWSMVRSPRHVAVGKWHDEPVP